MMSLLKRIYVAFLLFSLKLSFLMILLLFALFVVLFSLIPSLNMDLNFLVFFYPIFFVPKLFLNFINSASCVNLVTIPLPPLLLLLISIALFLIILVLLSPLMLKRRFLKKISLLLTMFPILLFIVFFALFTRISNFVKTSFLLIFALMSLSLLNLLILICLFFFLMLPMALLLISFKIGNWPILKGISIAFPLKLDKWSKPFVWICIRLILPLFVNSFLMLRLLPIDFTRFNFFLVLSIKLESFL